MPATRWLGGLVLGATAVLAIARGGRSEPPPPVPATPAGVLDVVVARPFTLERAATHEWRVERPRYASGYLLVLRVDPALVVPRQQPEPVLYVGRQTAERINHGFESGQVVAVVPGEIADPQHPDFIDLERDLVWFGAPELPERVSAAHIDAERRVAQRARMRPLPADRLAAARTRGGEVLRVRSKLDLLAAVVPLLERYSPQERALIDRLRLAVDAAPRAKE